MTRLAVVAGLCGIGAFAWMCYGPPRRPPSVPKGAVSVTFSKNGGWAYCWLDHESNVNRCRTYNWGGERLYRPLKKGDPDDVFLPYRGEGPLPESDLQIDTARTQIDFVWLRNGNVLLPRNDFQNQKEFVDELMAVLAN